MDELEEAELEVEALFLAVAQLVEGAQHDLQEAGEFLLAEEGGGACGAALLVGGDLQELAADAFGGFAFGREVCDLGHERVAQVADHLAGERRGGVAGVEEQVGGVHQLGGVAGVDGFEEALEDGVGHRAHQLANLRGGEDRAAVLRPARRRWPGP